LALGHNPCYLNSEKLGFLYISHSPLSFRAAAHYRKLNTVSTYSCFPQN
jgi:hypothetical protein